MSEKTNKVLSICLSILIAVLFWLFVDNAQGNTVTEEIRNVPVEFIGATDTLPSRGLMLAAGSDVTIDLTVSGPRTVVPGLTVDDFLIQVDLTGVSGMGTFPLTPKVQTAGNIDRGSVTVEKMSQSQVTVTIAELYEKTVPVEVSVVGEIAEGHIYMAEKLVAQPSSLTLRGREEDVDEVDSALVLLDLTGVSTTIHKEFNYQLLDRDGNVVENDNIQVSDKRIEVSAPVYIIRDLDLTVKWLEKPGSMLENVSWKLDHNTITVAGDPASLENKQDIVLGELDLSSFLSDTEVTLDINMPAGCENLSGYTTATVSVKFKNLETRAFSVTNISAIGLSSGQRFSRVTNVVDVVLRGSAEDLELVAPEDIRIVVDLEDYDSKGTYSVPAIVLVDGYDQVGAVGVYSVKCKISG